MVKNSATPISCIENISHATLATTGTLYIVATPIGNKDDISIRALNILKSVDIILAEDTRHSKQLLNLLGIQKPLDSFHAHNEANKTPHILSALQKGQSFALISDAGTPLISDPGYPLVHRAREKQIPVIPVPGACALITALSAAGVACDSFTFLGFLPAKAVARREKLLKCLISEHTLIIYESTHRIVECIEDILAIYGPSYQLVLAKELTKTFERFVSGSCQTIKDWLLENSAHQKGEFVLILPTVPKEEGLNEIDKEVMRILLKELSLKQAVKLASLFLKRNKNQLYPLALEISKNT